MCNSVRIELLCDRRSFRRRLGAQSMIDGQRCHLPAPRMGPLMRKPRQRHAVGAARNRDRKMRRRLEWAKSIDQMIKFMIREGRGHHHLYPGSGAAVFLPLALKCAFQPGGSFRIIAPQFLKHRAGFGFIVQARQ